MNQQLVKIAKKIGVDKAIAYSSGSRVVQGLTGVLSVFFITSFLTGVEQGFYYTFGSILALQVFFELGLTGIMTQYVAHEASHLQLNANYQYEGEEKYKSRLSSLIHFCVKWYFVLAIIVFLFLVVVGFVFFKTYGDKQSEEVSWQVPWLLICISTAINIFQSPFISILTGIGKIKEMSKIGFYLQLIVPVNWIGLALGFKLYILGLCGILSTALWQMYIWKTGLAKIIVNLWRVKVSERVSYFKEIFPYQWKIALSWISGYFIFQLFNPVLFATEGAVVAGQMGMTLSALNSIRAFSESWMNTKIPHYSKLIALKEYLNLDSLFNKTLKQMVSISSGLLLLFLFIIWILNVTGFRFGNHLLAERFLSYGPLLLMMTAVGFQQFISSWAMYLRCHKQEPFLVLSICNGIACLLSTFYLGKWFGLYGVTIGYCLITILVTPWAYWIYRTKKSEWHRT